MAKSKTYSLYLIKPEIDNFEDIFTETACSKINSGEVEIMHSEGLGDASSLYVFKNRAAPPNWLKDVKTVFTDATNFNNKTSSAIAVFKKNDRIFAATFAHGWQLLDDSKIEIDFGLKVAMNSLGESRVKRIDRSHLGEAIKGAASSHFNRDLQAFGLDEALDLVRKLSGKVDDNSFANSITGATSLKITKEMQFSEIDELANVALEEYNSKKYQNTVFAIIDKIRPILDKDLINKLDNEAIAKIKDNGDNFELSMPGWSEDDIVYYGFKGLSRKGRFPDLLLKNYRDALGDKIKGLDVETIASKHGVFAEFNNDASSTKRWSIKKALIGSIVFDGGLYAINEGEWYRLDENFKSDVEDVFSGLVKEWETDPLTIIKKISANGSKTGLESELEYNRRCAEKYGLICFDQVIMSVPSVPYGKFEACDLIDISNKKLIHVKKSSRQSSVLSHFFKQGSNSAKILKWYPDARNKLIEKTKELARDEDAEKLATNLGDTLSGWTVEFHIIDSPRKDGNFKVPFFSRITLKDEFLALNSMGFKVSLKFIPIPEIDDY